VLTALLALNVSKEIINAFLTIDEGITASNKNVTKKNQQVMDAFATAAQSDAVKAKPFQDKAIQVHKASDELNKYMEDLKNEMVRKVEGLGPNDPVPAPADIKKNDDYDISTLVMCGDKQDGKGFKATELKKKLEDYSPTGEDNLSSATPNGMPAWIIGNLYAGYNWKSLGISVGVDNILDTHYRTFASGINAPGRNFKVSLGYKF